MSEGSVSDRDLTRFLRARFIEDEAAAHVIDDGKRWRYSGDAWTGEGKLYTGTAEGSIDCPLRVVQHITRHDPVRVLREVEAKRRIVREYEIEAGRGPAGSRPDFVARHGGILDAYFVSLRGLASAYSDHPEYRQEWAL